MMKDSRMAAVTKKVAGGYLLFLDTHLNVHAHTAAIW